MREIAIAVAEFDVVFAVILFLSTLFKWFTLRKRIEENGWENMNPCDILTLLIYIIPVLGPMSFLAVMTVLDEGAVRKRTEKGTAISVVVGPMRYMFVDDAQKKKKGGQSFDE